MFPPVLVRLPSIIGHSAVVVICGVHPLVLIKSSNCGHKYLRIFVRSHCSCSRCRQPLDTHVFPGVFLCHMCCKKGYDTLHSRAERSRRLLQSALNQYSLPAGFKTLQDAVCAYYNKFYELREGQAKRAIGPENVLVSDNVYEMG